MPGQYLRSEQCAAIIRSMQSTGGGHRPGYFVVRFAPPDQERVNASVADSWDTTLAIFAILFVLWYSMSDGGYIFLSMFSVQTLGTSAAPLALIIWLARRVARIPRPQSSLAAVVQISPLGVQISTTFDSNGRASTLVGTPVFLPREDIVDVVVSEVVMGRSVESKVMFRVRRPTISNSGEDTYETHAKLMREGGVHLVDAFPLVKLSHVQCLTLCEGIMEDLDKL